MTTHDTTFQVYSDAEDCPCVPPDEDPDFKCVHTSDGIECFFEPICDRCAAKEAAQVDYDRYHPQGTAQDGDSIRICLLSPAGQFCRQCSEKPGAGDWREHDEDWASA